MELGNECEWFLLQFAEDDFAVQFTGSDPGTRFPAYMDGSPHSYLLKVNALQMNSSGGL